MSARLAPGFAIRSFAKLLTHVSSKVAAPDALDGGAWKFAITDPRLESFVPARILAASACVIAAIWLAGQRSRWSAIAPVSVNRLSTT